jgi:hypothetical protein
MKVLQKYFCYNTKNKKQINEYRIPLFEIYKHQNFQIVSVVL